MARFPALFTLLFAITSLAAAEIPISDPDVVPFLSSWISQPPIVAAGGGTVLVRSRTSSFPGRRF